MTSLSCISKWFSKCLHLNVINRVMTERPLLLFSPFSISFLSCSFFFSLPQSRKKVRLSTFTFFVLSHLTKWTYNWKRPDSNIYFYARNNNSHSFFFFNEKGRKKWIKGSCRRKTQPLWIIARKWSAEYYKRVLPFY